MMGVSNQQTNWLWRTVCSYFLIMPTPMAIWFYKKLYTQYTFTNINSPSWSSFLRKSTPLWCFPRRLIYWDIYWNTGVLKHSSYVFFQLPCFWLLIKRTVDINCILSDWLIFCLFLENFDGFVLIQHITLKYREQLTIMQYPKGENIFVNKM